MNRLHIATRGIRNWQDRLAQPGKHWKRGYSAFELAVSWELAAGQHSGLPSPIESLLRTRYQDVTLQLAVAEHEVDLPGGNAASQCDVWALVGSREGLISLSVEGKVNEPFGDHSLKDWLVAGKSLLSKGNRSHRWSCIRDNLPAASEEEYMPVAYQLLHRCATAIIEARRLRLSHAAFVVQQFPAKRHHSEEFRKFCAAIGVEAEQGRLMMTSVGDITLGVGWADCPLATDSDVANAC